MRRTAIRIIVCAGLVGAGWVAGRAQTAEPDFELIVNAPAGQTTVECHRGCDLAWVERGVIASSKPVQTFTFGCGGSAEGRCSSGRVGGWIRQ